MWLRIQQLDRSPLDELHRVQLYLVGHGIDCCVNQLRYTLTVQCAPRWITALPLLFAVEVREYDSLAELFSEYDADKQYRLKAVLK